MSVPATMVESWPLLAVVVVVSIVLYGVYRYASHRRQQRLAILGEVERLRRELAHRDALESQEHTPL